MALPYDRTPSPSREEPPIVESSAEPSALDMALDDFEPAVPTHVQDLLGRMGKGKVYLLEETPAILHVDGQERIRGDPRIATLAQQLDERDPTSWLLSVTGASPSPVRPTALFVRSELIQHLSTSKVFSWTTGLGASVMGIEWLNDTTLNLVFQTPVAALLALSLLSKAGFDPSEGDDPLLERAAHSIPISLLPMKEPEPVPSEAGQELLSSDVASSKQDDGIVRKGRGTFSGSRSGAFDLPALATGDEVPFELADGVNPMARVGIRYAVEADQALRAEANKSEWYRRHGRGAGKERATSSRTAGYGNRNGNGNREELLSFEGRGQGGEGREFARRIGKERRSDPYGRPRDRERERGKTQVDLDEELERMAKIRAAGESGIGLEGNEDVEMDVDVQRGGSYRNGKGRRGEARGKRSQEDLDRELDNMFAARVEEAT
ncbi:hypothetical protein BCR39DRAFT_517262 [Naematelia encephala]|uniref:Chromatin target of PRMT1 protein C-terminal domain-containing protein n=1 Tax=Naematelia encephala TaxID=71784 RepID=A0A1Y2BHK8_9TREE|nr:hypothetical protein BCR39DRAFT_517262 [Naematelia encephala]